MSPMQHPRTTYTLVEIKLIHIIGLERSIKNKVIKIEYLGDDANNGTRMYRLDLGTEVYSWIDMDTVMKLLFEKENDK